MDGTWEVHTVRKSYRAAAWRRRSSVIGVCYLPLNCRISSWSYSPLLELTLPDKDSKVFVPFAFWNSSHLQGYWIHHVRACMLIAWIPGSMQVFIKMFSRIKPLWQARNGILQGKQKEGVSYWAAIEEQLHTHTGDVELLNPVQSSGFWLIWSAFLFCLSRVPFEGLRLSTCWAVSHFQKNAQKNWTKRTAALNLQESSWFIRKFIIKKFQKKFCQNEIDYVEPTTNKREPFPDISYDVEGASRCAFWFILYRCNRTRLSLSLSLTGAVCRRDRLTVRFCLSLRWLDRCQLPNVRAQCCKTCGQRSLASQRHVSPLSRRDAGEIWATVCRSTIWALHWFPHHYRLIAYWSHYETLHVLAGGIITQVWQ